MRCIKTGCTLKCGDYNYHGDLFETYDLISDRAFDFVLKGVPQTNAGAFHYPADGYHDGEAGDLKHKETYSSSTGFTYGSFEVIDLLPNSELLAFFREWEPTLYSYFTQGK